MYLNFFKFFNETITNLLHFLQFSKSKNKKFHKIEFYFCSNNYAQIDYIIRRTVDKKNLLYNLRIYNLIIYEIFL